MKIIFVPCRKCEGLARNLSSTSGDQTRPERRITTEYASGRIANDHVNVAIGFVF